MNALVVHPLFGTDPILQAAVMTMFVLPPPFVIPLFMSKASRGRAHVRCEYPVVVHRW